MRRFKNILFVALDQQEVQGSLRRTLKLTAVNGAKLSVLGLVPAPSRLDRITHRAGGPLPELIANQLHQQLTVQIKRARSPIGVDVDVEVEVGISFITVIERVLGAEHDLLVVADGGLESPTVSTTKHLLRKCPCPVWVMRPSSARRHRILAAIDPLPDGETAALNRLILDLATSQALLTEADLHIAHAWTMYGESMLRNSAFIKASPEEIGRLLEETRDERQRQLEKTLAGYQTDGRRTHVHLVKGEPGEVIPNLASKHRATLLVMGTVGRSGVPGLVVGSTAERILDNVSCSILAVKPENFVSPVAGRHRNRRPISGRWVSRQASVNPPPTRENMKPL